MLGLLAVTVAHQARASKWEARAGRDSSPARGKSFLARQEAELSSLHGVTL